MRKLTALLALLLQCSGTTTSATTVSVTNRSPGMTSAEIVNARQVAFQLSAATLGSTRSAIGRGSDPKSYQFGARAVSRWARAVPTLFPDNTRGIGPSRAKADIWINKADFRAKAENYAAQADKLVETLAAGDAAAAIAQIDKTLDTCKSCHDVYRAEPTSS